MPRTNFSPYKQVLTSSHSGGPLDNQTWHPMAATKAFKVWFSQLHFGQWSSLPFCLQTFIVQWRTRIFYFLLLRMIVKLAYSATEVSAQSHWVYLLVILFGIIELFLGFSSFFCRSGQLGSHSINLRIQRRETEIEGKQKMDG